MNQIQVLSFMTYILMFLGIASLIVSILFENKFYAFFSMILMLLSMITNNKKHIFELYKRLNNTEVKK